MTGPVQHLSDRSDLDQSAEIHDRDPVSQRTDHREIVRDEEQGQTAIPLKLNQEIEDLTAHRDVEGRDRLVGDQESGIRSQGARDRHPLALAARELVRKPLRDLRRESDLRQQALDPSGKLATGREPESDQRFGDRFTYPHAGIERGLGILKDHLQITPPSAKLPPCQGEEVEPREADRPRRGLDQARDQTTEGRLAATRFPDQSERLSGFEVEIDVGDRAHPRTRSAKPSGTRPELLAELTHFEQRAQPTGSAEGASSQHSAPWPGAGSCQPGRSWRHRSRSSAQRGWKAQPAGRASGLGA